MDQLGLLRGGPILAVKHLPAQILRLCMAVLPGLPRDRDAVLHHADHAVVRGRGGDDRGRGPGDEDQLSRVSMLLPLLLPARRLLDQKEDQDYERSRFSNAVCASKYKCDYVPRDKMNCLVRLGNCFLRVALMYQLSCLLSCCQAKPGELAKKLLSKPQKQFILSLGNLGEII